MAPAAAAGLLVDEELARALRCESALAIKYWWGASQTSVWAWRQALGVPRLNEGVRTATDATEPGDRRGPGPTHAPTRGGSTPARANPENPRPPVAHPLSPP